ncbi:MAG TPA: ankyrin repeat domain-containing protein [Devosia sp.]|nr:ankyrin repeat domain-containing protein [Devosia sp.]
MPEETMEAFVEAIASGDERGASRLLARQPRLARERLERDAFRPSLLHQTYRGDTALHIVAAAYRSGLVGQLIALGAEIGAGNRRGATPLHYAADGGPGSRTWNPEAQVATIAALLEVGAKANAVDKSGVAPLHRAVRTRCAAAVRALIEGGADATLPTGSGSSPIDLATHQTGRGGSGSPEAKAQQAEIIRLLTAAVRR